MYPLYHSYLAYTNKKKFHPNMLCNSDMLHVVFSDWVMLASINWLVCLWLKYYYWVVIFIEHLFSVYGAKKKKKKSPITKVKEAMSKDWPKFSRAMIAKGNWIHFLWVKLLQPWGALVIFTSQRISPWSTALMTLCKLNSLSSSSYLTT